MGKETTVSKVQWVLQSTGLPIWHGEKVIEALWDQDIPCLNVGLIPTTDEITGLELIDPSIPTVFYGSTKLMELISINHPEYRPGVWWNDLKFKTGQIYNPKMLNPQVNIQRLDNVHHFIEGIKPFFIKPLSSLKTFGGFATTGPKFEEWFKENPLDLEPHSMVGISEYQDIWAEWRFFIVDGDVITGSIYRDSGGLYSKLAPPDMLLIAQAIANLGLPMKTCVMDLCLLSNGDIRIVEFNAVSAAGLYESDANKFVKAISQHAIESF